MAEWSTALQNTFPDSSFAWIAPGGHKDDEGKTVPRSLRHLVYKDANGKIDAAHTRNSLARLNQVEGLSGAEADRVRAKLEAALKTVTDAGKRAPGREYKTLGLSDATFADDGPGSFTGYASLWGIKDSQGDIVVKGAYTRTLNQFVERGFIAWGHNWDEPVATIREAREDAKGLFLDAEFHSDPASQTARTRTLERVERGKFMGLSIGYAVAEGGSERTKDARLLTDLTLYETSLVTVPALAPAGVTSAKAYYGGMAGGMDAEPPEGSYEELAEDLAEAYAAANGLPEERVQVVATFPGHAVLCVCPDYSGGMGPMGGTEYWDVPYTVGGDDDALVLGTPTAVDPQLSYVPSDEPADKGLWLPLRALKVGARHGKPTRERYAAMMQHATALVDHIGSLQRESDPPPPSKAGAVLYGEYLASLARRSGVAV